MHPDVPAGQLQESVSHSVSGWGPDRWVWLGNLPCNKKSITRRDKKSCEFARELHIDGRMHPGDDD